MAAFPGRSQVIASFNEASKEMGASALARKTKFVCLGCTEEHLQFEVTSCMTNNQCRASTIVR